MSQYSNYAVDRATYTQGYQACRNLVPVTDNPFTTGTPDFWLWRSGWYDALNNDALLELRHPYHQTGGQDNVGNETQATSDADAAAEAGAARSDVG